MPRTDRAGTCEEGLPEWRAAEGREAVWEDFVNILVRDDDSMKALGLLFYFIFAWFPKFIENQRIEKLYIEICQF